MGPRKLEGYPKASRTNGFHSVPATFPHRDIIDRGSTTYYSGFSCPGHIHQVGEDWHSTRSDRRKYQIIYPRMSSTIWYDFLVSGSLQDGTFLVQFCLPNHSPQHLQAGTCITCLCWGSTQARLCQRHAITDQDI
jgi:hypothetical protein